MIANYVGALFEGDAIETIGCEENTVLQYFSQFEVRLEYGRVHRVFLSANLLGVSRPIPGLELSLGFALHKLLSLLRFLASVGSGDRRNPAQHLVNTLRILGGLRVCCVLSKRGKTKQFCFLSSQTKHFLN